MAGRQAKRLASLVGFARERSAFYRRLYKHLPSPAALRLLPPVTKPVLMDSFDDWVTDPAVTRAGVEAFMEDLGQVARPYLGRYAVCRTSGTSGRPGVFVHDGGALAVYQTLNSMRGYMVWLPLRAQAAILLQRSRFASVLATGGHFAGLIFSGRPTREASCEGAGGFPPASGVRPRPSDIACSLSVMTPLPGLVRALNDFQPPVLITYPSQAILLAEEKAAGRLDIHPLIVVVSGEWFDPAAQSRVAMSGC